MVRKNGNMCKPIKQIASMRLDALAALACVSRGHFSLVFSRNNRRKMPSGFFDPSMFDVHACLELRTKKQRSGLTKTSFASKRLVRIIRRSSNDEANEVSRRLVVETLRFFSPVFS